MSARGKALASDADAKENDESEGTRGSRPRRQFRNTVYPKRESATLHCAGRNGRAQHKSTERPMRASLLAGTLLLAPRSVLDFPLFLAAVLLRVALVLPALGIALVVFGPAIDFA